MVNGYPARKEAVHGLYILISRLEVEAPVSRSIEERIMNGLNKRTGGSVTGVGAEDSAGIPAEAFNAVKIGMSDGREKNYRVFYDSLSGSTFMKLEGSGIAFRVGVRGYRQRNLAELFQADPRFWRDNVIFHCPPGDIQSVSLVYRLEPARSFHLARNDAGEFEIASGDVPENWQSLSRDIVTQYLGYFYDVRFEAFLDPGRDTLGHFEDPDVVISLGLAGRERRILELYPVYRYTAQGGRQPDYNIIYARTGKGEEWLVMKYVQVDPLLQEFEYFKGF